MSNTNLIKTRIAEWGLALIITAAATAITLALIRHYAPNLLGIHNDLQLVQIDKKVPPFFEGALRSEDSKVQNVTTADPLTKVRGRPFLPNMGTMGPNDLLGFRNRTIPARADIVTIGDSQTYGNNASIESNWPEQISGYLSPYNATLYNMSTGGWGPIQYYYAFQKASFFQPKIIVVAFYTGNDGPDAFQMAYGNPQWSQFKTDKALSISDMPKIVFPPEEDDKLPINIKPGVSTVFTPRYRGSCIKKDPAIDAGFEIMIRVIKEMALIAEEEQIRLLVTLIPTKEFAYRNAITDQLITSNPSYQQLIKDESQRFADFESVISRIAGVKYISVAKPLTSAASTFNEAIYPDNEDGHPLAAGYKIIADTLNEEIQKMYLDGFTGPVAVSRSNSSKILLIHKKHYVEVDHINPVTKDGSSHFDIPKWSSLPTAMIRLASSADEGFKDIDLDNYKDKIDRAINHESSSQ